eukprot:CCRYP_008253-RA/>CCRYP_008253-RA protein AED:0.19 eAED:0.19 QI:0/-1/0/1/-1/1/1/0/370
MDRFSNFMNGNYSHGDQAADNNGGNPLNFNDISGFRNQICLPVRNTSPSMDGMPSLPTGEHMFGVYQNNANNNSNLFGNFANDSQMASQIMNNGQMLSQLNGSNQMTSQSEDALPSFENSNFNSSDDSVANAASSFDKSKSVPPSKSGIKFYSRNDVLCGRGGGTNVHPGNRRFRDLINANRRAYLKARKNDKPAISRSIVRTIREMNGRFLKKDEKLGLWFEIGDDGAREKTSQALRQRAPEMRKILFDDEQRMRTEQLARQQQQAALLQRSFINNQSMNNNNFSMNSQMMGVGNNMDDTNSNNVSIHEQYAMLQQKNYFAREKDVFLKKLAMAGFNPSTFQSQQNKIECMTTQTLLNQGLKPITPRGA